MRLYKNILAILTVVLSTVALQAQQLTHPMEVVITAPSSLAGNYQYGYQTDWGPTTLPTTTGQLVWAYDITPDTIACDSIPANGYLTGKVALVRRGTCNFSLKALNAQNAGAIGCVICNNDGGSGTINMAGGTFGPQVTIPAVMLSDQNCALIAAALANGDSVSITFRKPTLSSDLLTFDYERPQSQIEPLASQEFSVTNVGASTVTNFSNTLTIWSPNGTPTTLTETVASLDPDSTVAVPFTGTYTPVDTGMYTIVAKTSIAPGDSLVQYFHIGDYTYTLDEQGNHSQPFSWIGITDAAFGTANFRFDMGNVYRVTNNGYATWATFSLDRDNAAYYFGKVFTIRLYQLPTGLTGSEQDYSTFTLVGIAVDTIDATDTVANPVMITKRLLDVNTLADSVAMVGGNRYLLVVSHEGTGDLTTSPRFNASGNDELIDLGVVVYTDRLYMGGFGEDSPKGVMRLHMKGYWESPVAVHHAFIDPAKFEVFPNPASDVLNVAIALDEMAENMNVSLVDINGRTVAAQQFSNAQQTNAQFDTTELPAGFYFVRIQTEAGVRVKEFVKK